MGQLNIELFEKIREKIATTPEAYDQQVWGRRDKSAPCGTACCIAGWACVLSGELSLEEARDLGRDGETSGDHEYRHASDIASEALGLDEDEADALFTSDPAGDWHEGADEEDDDEGSYYEGGGWPEEFASDWRAAKTNKEQADVAIAYLTHIIESGKVLE